jgi:hypothetical protein
MSKDEKISRLIIAMRNMRAWAVYLMATSNPELKPETLIKYCNQTLALVGAEEGGKEK